MSVFEIFLVDQDEVDRFRAGLAMAGYDEEVCQEFDSAGISLDLRPASNRIVAEVLWDKEPDSFLCGEQIFELEVINMDTGWWMPWEDALITMRQIRDLAVQSWRRGCDVGMAFAAKRAS